jgi:hypothetical protein
MCKWRIRTLMNGNNSDCLHCAISFKWHVSGNCCQSRGRRRRLDIAQKVETDLIKYSTIVRFQSMPSRSTCLFRRSRQPLYWYALDFCCQRSSLLLDSPPTPTLHPLRCSYSPTISTSAFQTKQFNSPKVRPGWLPSLTSAEQFLKCCGLPRSGNIAC